MSKVKNVSGGPLDVPMLNRSVEDGEVVEVPDFQPGHTDENPLPIDWPANRWEPVTDAGKGKSQDNDDTEAAE